MSSVEDHRYSLYKNVDSEEQFKILAVVNSCLDSFPLENQNTFAAQLSFACDSCNSSDILHMWDFGICQYPPLNTFRILVYFSYIFILAFAVIGNVFIVHAVVSSSKMKTVTNYFIANLAIGDLCMATLCVPFSFISALILRYWPFGTELCIAVNYLQAVAVFTSAYTLVAISFDRYIAIIYPLKPRLTRCKAKIIILFVWLMSLLTTLPIAFFSKLWMPPTNFYTLYNRQVCTEEWGDYQRMRTIYGFTLMLLQYFLPVVVLIFTYSKIALVVWGKRSLGETPACRERIAKSKQKMVKTMVVVVLVYSLCWLPHNILMVLRDVHPAINNWEGIMFLWTFFHWLAMSHTCYNPLILCWMNSKFRSSFCYIAYKLPCLRKWTRRHCTEMRDSSVPIQELNHFSLPAKRFVIISLKDDTIVFKRHHPNSSSGSNSQKKNDLLQDLDEDRNSDSSSAKKTLHETAYV